jgi:hypothetical protein
LFWVAEFSGKFVRDKGGGSLCMRPASGVPPYNDVDLNNNEKGKGGVCIISDAAGDQAYLSWRCEGDGVHCAGSFEYTGGTGKYQSIAGSQRYQSQFSE